MKCGGGGGGLGGGGNEGKHPSPPCSVYLKSSFFRFFLFNFTFNFYGTPFNSNTVVVTRTTFELR